MLWAVIMAGGSGTRFWPASRRLKPKQFLRLFGKKTLFEETLSRIQPVISSSRVLAVTQDFNVSLVKQLSKLPAAHILGEPIGRNTAPCAVLAAAMAYKKDPDAVLALLPADHLISDVKSFQRSLKHASEVAAREGLPVTFGIKPAFPHTGYGYLECGELFEKKKGAEVYRLKRFCEKPDLKTAQSFLKAGRYLWNSGIFVWKAESLLAEAQKHLREVYMLSQKIVQKPAQFKKLFPSMPNISIDYGLMEKMKGSILTIPAAFDWSDLGNWQSSSDLWPKDISGNAVHGTALFHKSTGNIVKAADRRMVVLLGVKDHIVIDTPDALLVCAKNESESLRDVVKALHDQKKHRYL